MFPILKLHTELFACCVLDHQEVKNKDKQNKGHRKTNRKTVRQKRKKNKKPKTIFIKLLLKYIIN
jgi:hypothetical protein